MSYAYTLWALITGLNFGPNASKDYFNKNVRPVIQTRCAGCHAGMAGQDWTRYDSAKRAASKINFRVFVLKDMPPPSSQPLTGSEKSTIKMWLDAEQQGNK